MKHKKDDFTVMRFLWLALLFLISSNDSFAVFAASSIQKSDNEKTKPTEKGHFYCSEIYWSSQNHNLQLFGDEIVIDYLDNHFRGKGSATFLINEKFIFLNGKLMDGDTRISVQNYKCALVRINEKTLLKKYGLQNRNGGIEIHYDSNLSKTSFTKRSKDSILVKGKIVWEDSAITGYPLNIKITPLASPKLEIVQSIDSLGSFKAELVPGKYTILPELNYHWMGEELIRIDEKKSKTLLEVKPKTSNNITVQWDTIPWPKKNFKSGILTTSNEIDFGDVDDFMNERMTFFEIPGATLSLIKDNKIIYSQTYGVTNAITNQSVSPSTLFEAGSITKLVFAFAVMRLYEKGQIDLDKPLYEYLTFDAINDERYKSMTARHVLSHQSGMANWPKRDEDEKFKLKSHPGTSYGYSGEAFEYLKRVVESITSKSIDTILMEEVIEPLELTNMHFKGNDSIAKYGANGHKKYVPSAIFMAKSTQVSYTLQTNSRALAKFATALMDRKGLQAKTYDEMFKVHSIRNDGTKWGLGVRIEDSELGLSFGHSGSTSRGFIGNLVFYPDSGIGYTIITNCQMGGWLSLPLLNEYLILGTSNQKR